MKRTWMWIVLVLSFGVNAMGAAAEITRVVQDVLYSMARQRAKTTQTLNSFDSGGVQCRYYLPHSDMPSDHFAGHVFPIVLHLLVAGLYLMMLAADVNTHWWSKRVAQWLDAFSLNTSTWFEGAVQLLVASIVLGLPVNIYGNNRTVFWRYFTGMATYAAGLGNIFVGMLLQGDVRAFRGQVRTDKQLKMAIAQDNEKAYNCMAAFLKMDGVLQHVTLGGDHGALMDAKTELRKAIQACY